MKQLQHLIVKTSDLEKYIRFCNETVIHLHVKLSECYYFQEV
jgi:hypothetical protein